MAKEKFSAVEFLKGKLNTDANRVKNSVLEASRKLYGVEFTGLTQVKRHTEATVIDSMPIKDEEKIFACAVLKVTSKADLEKLNALKTE